MIRLEIDRSVFNDVYYPYLTDYSTRYLVLYGGAGSGKSHFLAQRWIYKALMSKRKILVIRKYGTTLKDSVFQLMCDVLSQWRIWSYCKVNLSTYTITLPNGSQFLFKGLDDPEKIKSITDITDIWCEEATELSEDEFSQLDLRMRSLVEGSEIVCSFNPVSKANWVYKRWFGDEKVTDNTRILWTNYKHNRFLPEAYTEALESQARTNPTYYKIYALGEFATLDKLIYNNWRIEEFDHSKVKGELCIGLDFGFTNDPTALVASIVTEDTIYIFREWGDTGKTNPEIADVIKSLGFAKSVIIADSAEVKSIEEIRRSGIRRITESKKGADSILHGIQRVQQYQIVVHPSCTGTIVELENYSWQKDKKSGEYVNKAQDQFNHYLDSLRYSLQCMDKQRMKTFDKSLLGL